MRKLLVLLTICAMTAVLVLAGTVQGKPLPDNAAVNQYVEALPGAAGAEPSSAAVTAGALQVQGTDRIRAAALARATAPDRGATGSSSSGMGIALPLIMLASLLAAVALFVARRRHRTA
jgi:hypothetical protein